MRLVESLSEIDKVDRKLSDIFEGFRMVPGSVCRIAHQYLANWGIAVTPGNREQIEARSLESYSREWRQSNADYHFAIRRATTRAGIQYDNDNLNDYVANKAALIIESMLSDRKKSEYRILDIGAGSGKTTLKVLDVLRIRGVDQGILSRCQFYLLEPADQALKKALETIRERGTKSRVVPVGTSIQDHMETTADGTYNMVISSAVFHHMSFPGYLERIYTKLADEGVMIIGDWHTTIWSQPAFLVPILKDLGADSTRIRDFETFFGVKREDDVRLSKSLAEKEAKANRYMLDYEKHLAEELRGTNDKAKLYLFEAHESLSDRLANYGQAGFVVDLDELRANHRAFVDMKRNVTKLKGEELAAVVAMAKVSVTRSRLKGPVTCT
ncbi:MAG: class I SAM-dependent methyltransferase [Candidatus Micrarchaeia archaeon]